MSVKLPLVIEPSELKEHLNNDDVVIIDLSSPATYVQYHVAGAVFLNYEWIVRVEHPRMGLLPSQEQLTNVLTSLGINDKHVVVYDDEGGGRACRFLWTLEVAGHKGYSILNGGIQAWTKSGNQVSSEITHPTPDEYKVEMNFEPVATRQFILDHLSDDNFMIFDNRSPAEFNGEKIFAQRGGHIPGAINMDWTDAMDIDNGKCFKPKKELIKMLEAMGISKDKTIITHCQAHHRSAHTYIMLKSLGYENVKGYPGAWSDWGNEPNTPIE